MGTFPFGTIPTELQSTLYPTHVSLELLYHYYKKDKSSFIVNETLLKNRENGELTYYDMLYYSLLLNFTISFGDVVPLTDEIKVITSLQTFIFWYIALY